MRTSSLRSVVAALLAAVAASSAIVAAQLVLPDLRDLSDLAPQLRLPDDDYSFSSPASDYFDGSVSSCHDDSFIFIPSKIAITPDPPRRNAKLTVEIEGNLKEDVVEGAYADATVKLGVIKLVDKRLNLCDELRNIHKDCPIEKGHILMNHTVDIPREVPPGKYTIRVVGANNDGKPLACLDIVFRM